MNEDVSSRLKTLLEDDFVLARPKGHFALTDFGRFVAEFELNPAVSNELTVYSELRKYLEGGFDRGEELPFTPEVLFRVCRILGLSVPKNRSVTLDSETIRVFTSRGWDPNDGAARLAIAVFLGWLQGFRAGTIESKFGVYVEAIQAASEILAMEAVPLIVGMATLQGIIPNTVYENLPERLRYGVTEEMLNLVRIEGIGRKRALAIVGACDALTVNTAMSTAYHGKPQGSEMKYKGKSIGKTGERVTPADVWDFLCRFHKAYGDDEFGKLVTSAEGIGKVLSERVLAAIRPDNA